VTSKLLTANQLCKELKIDAKKLAGFVKAGLPHKGKGKAQRFDGDAVIEWLVAKGYAQPPAPAGPVAATIAEAAEVLGVHRRTLAEWCNDPTFPGTPGPPGRREGHFPIDEIKAWQARNFPAGGGSSSNELAELKAAKLRVQVEREQLEFAKELNAIVELDDVRNLIESAINTAKSIFDEFPEQCVASMPGNLDKKLKNKIRELAERKKNEAYEMLAAMFHDDDDEESEEPAADAPAKPAKR
jgi:phage terminase Nu1 subunit (DNA packaging protein)